MKKLLALVLVLCFVAPVAHAEDKKIFPRLYDRYADLLCAPKITGEVVKSGKLSFYETKAGLYVGYSENESGDIDGYFVICNNPEYEADYISACLIILAMDGSLYDTSAYGYLLMNLIHIKNDENPEVAISVTRNYHVFKMEKRELDGAYVFMLGL